MSNSVIGHLFGTTLYYGSTLLNIVLLVSLWRIYTKSGHPGWKMLIPFYNFYVLFQIVYGGNRGWSFLTMFIPIYNIWVLIKLYRDLPKAFGLPGIFGLGLVLFPIIFFPVLSFGKYEYIMS